jgi:multidrug efflux pump subunit AcrA (membrane-fusion protein)
MDYPRGLNVLPGMSVSLEVDMPSLDVVKDGSFMVPSSALFAHEDGANYLWVVDENTNAVIRRKVSMGSLEGSNVEVSGDISAGERIVVAGVHLLHEGQTVRFTD